MRPYFQAHTIVVYTDMPLRQALHKPEKSGRLMYWAIDLGEYDIIYEPKSSLKGHAVTDFIAEVTYPDTPEEQKLLADQPVDVTGSTNTSSNQFRLVKGHVDVTGCDAEIVVRTPDEEQELLANQPVDVTGSTNTSPDQLRLVKGQVDVIGSLNSSSD